MELKRIKRTAWEYSTIICVVGLGIALSVALYARRDQVFKERLLILELLTHRNYVIAYTLEHRKHPAHLNANPGSKMDPFGNPYQYDPKSGWVSSTTPSYSNW